MNRISDIWTYETDKTLPETFKALSTLEHVYDTETGFTELNTNIDVSPFYIKATGENLFYGGVDMPRDAEQPTKTPIETSETYLGLACIYNAEYYTNNLMSISMVDYTSYIIQKQPTIASTKKPVTSSYWNNSTSYQTKQQSILTTYDYTKVKLYANIVIIYKEGYNWRTTTTSIKDCANYKNDSTAKIIGISIDTITYKNSVSNLPSNSTIVANITYDDMSLQTPLGNLTSDSDTPLRYTSDAVYDRLMINPIYLDLDADLIDSYYIPFNVALDDTDTMCKMLASIGYIIQCDVDDTHSTIYPIITGGMCDGSYTLDENEFNESENSKWNDTDDINPPSPTPSDPDDSVDDMLYNLYGTVGGNIRYYRITQSELAKLGQGIQSEDFVNPLQNIVCLNQYPFAVDPHIFNTYGNEDILIQGKSTGAVGRPVTNYIQYWGVESIDVPNLHNNFLDNAPYTQYELYIPFCGWVQLPDFVHGHTLTVTLLNDIITTSVRGIVHCNLNGNNVIVAEKQGAFGTSCPLSSNDEGSKQNALTGAMFNTLGGLMSTGFALTTGNAIGTVSGLMSTVGAITQGNIANNNNYVSSVGASGDRTNFANYDKIYLKINTVYSNEPTDYNHTYGRPCNKSGAVSSFTGYTICSNFNTDGLSCSETEKTMIKNIFESGVYL